MADRYWVNDDADGSWNNTNNWSATSGGSGGAGIPTSSDDVIFDGNGTDDCTCDVAIDILSIDVQSDYSGTLDFADSSYSHAIDGNAIFNSSGVVDLGDCVITINGDFDYQDQSGIVKGTSTVVLSGTAKNLKANSTYINDVEVSGSYSNNGGIYLYVKDITIKNGGSLDGDKGIFIASAGTFTCENNSVFNPVTISYLVACTGAKSFTLNIDSGATFSPSGNTTGKDLSCGRACNINVTGGTIATIDCNCSFGTGDGIVTFGTGSFIITGAFVCSVDNVANSRTIANNTNNPNLTFKDEFLLDETAGTLLWNKGTGTISFEGTSNQDIDFNGESVEDIEIDKTAGTVTLSSDLTTDSLTLTDGTLDIDANNVTTIGAFTQAADTTCQDTTGGGLITIGENFAINGSSGNECTWNGPDLDVTGTANASYTTVTNSDASAGTEITTTNCTDSGGNTNWAFGLSLIIAKVIQNQSIDNIALLQQSLLSITDVTQGQELNNIILSFLDILQISSSSQGQVVDDLLLSQQLDLIIAGISQGQDVDVITLIQQAILNITKISQAQTIDNLSLLSATILTIAKLNQSQEVDDLNFLQQSNMTIADIAQGQSLDNIVLLYGDVLVITGISQSQTSDNISLVQQNLLSVADINQVQTTDNVVLSVAGLLEIANLVQTQNLDIINLQQNFALVIDSLFQTQNTANIILDSSQILAIQKLVQTQLVDVISLVQQSVLNVDEISQQQILDNIEIVITRIAGKLSVTFQLKTPGGRFTLR